MSRVRVACGGSPGTAERRGTAAAATMWGVVSGRGSPANRPEGGGSGVVVRFGPG